VAVAVVLGLNDVLSVLADSQCSTMYCRSAATLLGFEPLPPSVLVASGAVVLLYMITAEAAKAAFYKNRGRQGTQKGRARVTRPFLAVR